MITGIKFQAKPTNEQAKTLAQWMGCAKFIWNAKCDEDHYLRTYATKYLTTGTFPRVDQTYSQYKSKSLSPWLNDCPSQILRNSATNWYNTYQKFLKGICGRPKHKKRSNQGSVHLTSELFELEQINGQWQLKIGTKSRNIGVLKVKFHRKFGIPKSIYIKRNHNHWSVSFCYEDNATVDNTLEDHFKYLQQCTRTELESKVIGIDRGVVRPIQFGDTVINYTEQQLKKIKGHERHLRQLQRKIARQQKDSNRRRKTLYRVARKKAQQGNIRHDFCHKASRTIVSSTKSVFVFENLKTKNMTRSAKGTSVKHGKNVRQKSGLNRSILSIGWHKIQSFNEYKAAREGKAVFYVSPHHTSLACANCGHTHPDNRRSQSEFVCIQCGHTDNADANASSNIKQRAINLFLDSGTELSAKGVLSPKSDIGRGAMRQTQYLKGVVQRASKRQQKTVALAA
ncbi:transposase [Alishewanella sp. 16-MA]|uniref:Transposase n=1 Tax=Alishewanella maricola TaxID=2795740 RepID=A0ABS8C163_9ALTE|nr:transposase [Alishewanella maricola]MCB5226043.1 transposase [Alishewanella maricola]